MKNDRNIRYAIMTLNGFLLDPDIGGTWQFHSAEEAMKHMKPGNAIIPIKDASQLFDYESGKVRLPSVNRAGFRNTPKIPGQQKQP